MPRLYEYFGLVIMFYSNEHEPVHVHGRYQNYESKAEFVIENGRVVGIQYASVRGRRPLPPSQMRDFEELTARFAEEIVQKWIDFFVLHKRLSLQRITR